LGDFIIFLEILFLALVYQIFTCFALVEMANSVIPNSILFVVVLRAV